ncbi:MAG: hypothetical protein DRO67_01780 [Candidatus Asgardarchaeum californiense]|nr:MAG: hypothetical protein DRO67_01780 [Candidatus Asgardarchaeum californiense]
MKFEEISKTCRWRVIAREESVCKACIKQPNNYECSESNCALYQFASCILDEMRGDLHNVIKTLLEQMEDRLDNKKLMTNYIHKII